MSEKKAKGAGESPEDVVNRTSIDGIFRAAQQLDGVAIKTRLIESPYFSDICGNTVYETRKSPEHRLIQAAWRIQ